MTTTSLSLPGTVFHTKCSRPKGELGAPDFQTFWPIDCERAADGTIFDFQLNYFADFFAAAQRFLCAVAIRSRASGLNLRFARRLPIVEGNVGTTLPS